MHTTDGAVLAIALDVPDASRAFALADLFAGLPVWMKVGLELFTAQGPALAKALLDRGYPVFLDLKFHDIPNTVSGAVRAASLLGVDMCTLHVSGGEAMCRAASAARAEMKDSGAKAPLLMGITVLTSQAGNAADLKSQVTARALEAQAWGLDGIVCSGFEASAVKEACGRDFLCLCPGIRFERRKEESDDQSRVCTPGEAVAAGADFLVMGRPILRAQDPAAAAREALDAMKTSSGFAGGSARQGGRRS